MAKKRPTLDAFLGLQNNTEEAVAEEVIPNKTSSRSTNPVSSELKIAQKPKTTKPNEKPVNSPSPSSLQKSEKYEVIRHMLYLPMPVYDQLQGLIYEEQRGQSKRRKTHDYLLDAIDLLFKKKGLKSIGELTARD